MSNITLTSGDNSSPAELEHAVSPNWREPFVEPNSVSESAGNEDELQPEANADEAKIAADEGKADSTEGEKQTPKKAKQGTPPWAQKRFDKLTARAKEAEERAKNSIPREEHERIIEERVAERLKTLTTPADPNEEYVKKIKAEAVAEAREEFEKIRREDAFRQRIQSKLPEGFTYEQLQALATQITVPQAAIEAIAAQPHDIADELMIHVIEHPEVAGNLNKIYEMKGEKAAAAEIGRLAVRLEMDLEKTRSPQPKARVTPPPPIKTVGAASTRSSAPIDDDSVPVSEFIKIRNKQEAAKRAGR